MISTATYIAILFVTFWGMEFMAWFLHKYVMHGPLWALHYDHHNKNPHRSYQLNDAFALFFAVPSFLLILFDSMYGHPILGAIGFGIMAYGAAYFFVHEIIIHRRWRFTNIKSNTYTRGLNAAHKIHHSVTVKEGATNFGMLIVPFKYFKKRTVETNIKTL